MTNYRIPITLSETVQRLFVIVLFIYSVYQVCNIGC